MKITRFAALLALLPLGLCAQEPAAPAPVSAPAPASTPQAAPNPNLAQQLRAQVGEVDRLTKELKPREALALVEPLLPQALPTFDKSNPQASLASYQSHRELVYAYFLAAQAADAGGYWEKALDYFAQAKTLSKNNAEGVKESFPPLLDYYKNLVEGSKRVLAENAEFIASLRSKPNPDPGEQQQLDLIKGEEVSIDKNTKMLTTLGGYVEGTKREAEHYANLYDQMEKQVEQEKERLEKYQFKNDKVKFVEGIASAKGYMEKLGERADKVRYLYRLNVLDPSNIKIIRMIKVETGVDVAPAKAAPAPKGKKR